ncbi:MAG: MFS transporter, partial [Dehalococcoidia bacterium]
VVVTGIVGGALVDRLGAKRVSVLSDAASAVAVFAVPLLYHTVGLAYWQLLVLVFLGAVLDTPGMTARRSLYPDLAQAAGVSLERANATYQIVYRLAGLLAPPLAGVLIAAIGASNLLWIDAVTFLISAAIVAAAVPSRARTAQPSQGGTPRRYLEDIREGFRFILRDPVILAITATFSLGSLLAEPVYSVVLPVYAREVFGSAVDLGFMFAALAVGSLAGNAIFLMWGPRLPRRGLLITGFAVRASTLWVLVFMPPLSVIVASVMVNATFLEPANPLSMTILQERVPPAMRGRVFGAMMAVGAGTLPLGMVIYGNLLEMAGLQTTLFLLAAVNLAVPLSMLLLPGYRLLGREQQRPVGAPVLSDAPHGT